MPENVRPAYDLLVRAGVAEHEAFGMAFLGIDALAASKLAATLAQPTGSIGSFGPKAVAISALARAAAHGEVNGRELRQLIADHGELFVVRPDGVVAEAMTGKAIVRAGHVHIDDDVLKAGVLDVGAFLRESEGLYFPVRADLSEDHDVGRAFEPALKHGALGLVMDGAGDAFRSMVVTVAALIKDPPGTVAAAVESLGHIGELLTATPELADRFLHAPRAEQIRTASKLAVTLALAKGAMDAGAGFIPNGGGGLGEVLLGGGASAAEATMSLGFRLELAQAGVLVAGSAVAFAGPLSLAPLLAERGPDSKLARVGDKAAASLKRVARLLDDEAAKAKARALPRIDALRQDALRRLDELLSNEKLSELSRSNFDAARNGLRDHLTPEDLAGALRDELNLPVRERGTGDLFQHRKEVREALASLVAARKSLAYEFQKACWRGLARPELSSLADDLLDLRKQIEAFRRVEP